MQTIYLYLIFLCAANVLELILFEGTFSHFMEKKPHFLLRCVGSIAVILLLLALACAGIVRLWGGGFAFDILNEELLRIALNSITFVGFIGGCFFAYDEEPALVIYTAIAGAVSRAIFTSLYSILLLTKDAYSVYVVLLDPIDFYSVFFYVFALVITLLISYFVFTKPLMELRREFDQSFNAYVLFVFLLFLCFSVCFQGSNVILACGSKRVIVLYHAFVIVFCVAILAVERFILAWIRNIQDKTAAERLYENYRIQSEQAQRNMELVNIKCHDLKHQLRLALEGQQLDESFVRDVQQTISIYDTHVKTGNDALDTLLMEKMLYCEVLGIELSVMVDGHAFSFLSVSDTYSFFGNALDNAIEHLTQEAAENRFIRMSSHRMGDILTIRIENYCSTEPETDRNGIPKSQKKDREHHGFGLLSMKNIAEKYGGVLSCAVEERMFVLTAVFCVA